MGSYRPHTHRRAYALIAVSFWIAVGLISTAEGVDSNKLSNACKAHHQALHLLDKLQPAPDAHVTIRRNGGLSSASWSAWLKPDTGGGEGDSSPLLKAKHLLQSLLHALLEILLLPLTILPSLLTYTFSLLHLPIPSFISGSASALTGLGAGGKDQGRVVVELLREATEGGVRRLGGLEGLSPDIPTALKSFQAMNNLSKGSADATSQFLEGFLYASGLEGVEVDQSKALLYYTFAAAQGLPEAQLALGYRYWMGIGVKEDCMQALDWYESVAHKSYQTYLSGPPGGRTLPLGNYRLSDLAGGAFGRGASSASTGMAARRAAIKASGTVNGGANYDDVLQYYTYHSDRAQHEFSVTLGRIYYTGSVYTMPGGISSGAESVGETIQSFPLAYSYFLRAADALWATTSTTDESIDSTSGLPAGFSASWGQRKLSAEVMAGVKQPAATAAAFLGRMWLRGEGVERDYVKARMWLIRASELGDREGHNMLGIMYRDGLGVKSDQNAAKIYFGAAAALNLAEARTHIGAMNYDGQPAHEPQAMADFTTAAEHGNAFEAFYHLGLIHANNARREGPNGGKRSGTCGVAIGYLKLMAERGSWEWDMMKQADRAWKRGERVTALIRWWIAGEMGYEIAQNNVAFLLDQVHRSKASKGVNNIYSFTASDKVDIAKDVGLSALTHWIRSANQNNLDALVKVGDYHYNGIGISNSDNRYEKAAGSYQSAADTQASAVAFWNLGWMYENGLGVVQDWHLAKRYYDLCFSTDIEAEWPARLALVKLWLRSYWAELIGGKGKGGKKHMGLFGVKRGIEAGVGGDELDTYGGARAGREAGQAGVENADEDENLDLVEWARKRQRDELDNTPYDDYLETGRAQRQRQRPRQRQANSQQPHGDDLDIDDDTDELFETLAIALLVIGFSGLMWVRGRWARQRAEREEDERRARGGAVPGVGIAGGPGVGPPAAAPGQGVEPLPFGFPPLP